jgi:NAD(P)-dependent dehydrogenase (short-subunit alcohol dehydrogenase family)
MARVAIVTGGTRGIGEAISLALKEQGRQVVANYAGNEERRRPLPKRRAFPRSAGTWVIMRLRWPQWPELPNSTDLSTS